ncbi:MAG: IS66 family insertion sequence element accessory protein TnpB [Bacteroidales bacterium]|jgi:transposase|nr:IS66 family insertion sequence element accessory protein TnpB [Bacteroidales bacterium]
MIVDLSKVKIFLRPGITDMRKAVNGLSVIVQENMKQDPFSGSVYLFCNRERKLLKAVYWDKSGFWLSQKRLEKDKFPWPQDASEAKELTGDQLQMLLIGIDFFKAHKELFYKKIA